MYITPTNWELWKKCTEANSRQTQKLFWSDIILYVKKNPGKNIFFEQLIKNTGVKSRSYNGCSAPLPIIVKKFLNDARSYNEKDWLTIIHEWSEIKIDLKLRIQSIILRKGEEIKEFIDEIFNGSKTTKQLVLKVSTESGFLGKFSKEDIVLMLCILLTDKIEEQRKQKEFDANMAEGVFQVIEEPTTEIKQSISTEAKLPAVYENASISNMPTDMENKQLRIILGRFIYELKAQTPLQEDWDEVKVFLEEAAKITENKIIEREEIIKRRRLTEDFSSKVGSITKKFAVQISNLGLNIPPVDKIKDLTNEQLGICVDAFDGLQVVLNKYHDLTTTTSHNLGEEKKRISSLLAVMNDIEGYVGTITDVMSKKSSANKENLIDPMNTITSLFQNSKDEKTDDTKQIALFSK